MRKYKSNMEDTGSIEIYKQNFDGLRDEDDYEAQKRAIEKRDSLKGKRSSQSSKKSGNKKNKHSKKNGFNISNLDIRNMNKYQKRRFGAVLILVLLIVLIIIVNIGNKHKTPEKVSFMLNNEYIDLKNIMYYEDDVAYISKEDVIQLFDNNLYYNEAEKELITTYNTHIAVLNQNAKQMRLNDSNINLNGTMQEKDSIIYLPLSDMQIVYDLELEYSKDYNRVICTSIKDERVRSLVIKKANLKETNGLFSKTIEKLPIGHYVYILENAGSKQLVRSENGNIGYISNKSISDVEVLHTKMIEENVTYNIVDSNDIVKNYNDVTLRNDSKNVVAPMFFTINENGEIVDKTASKTTNYNDFKEWCNTNDVGILAGVDLDADTSQVFLTYSDRNTIIQELYNNVMEYGFQGITINFDKVDDINSFNRFLIEIKPKFKESGLKVAVKINSDFDANESSKINDIVDISM